MTSNAPSFSALTDAEHTALPSGGTRESLRLAVRLLDLAELRQRPAEMTQTLSQVARCYKALGAWGPAESYLAQALRWSRMLGGVDMAVELLCDLAEVQCSLAEVHDEEEGRSNLAALEYARDHVFEAATLARQASDAHWEVKVLLRVSDVLDRCGDHDDAISLQTRALSLMSAEHSGFGDLAMEPGADALRSPAPVALM
jgi:tetratricopeptide (TPR) repeat protein